MFRMVRQTKKTDLLLSAIMVTYLLKTMIDLFQQFAFGNSEL